MSTPCPTHPVLRAATRTLLLVPSAALLTLLLIPSPAASQRPYAVQAAPGAPVAHATAAPTPARVADTGPKKLPNTTLRDRVGRKVALSKFLGKKPILLYLYSVPVDRTAIDLQNLQAQMDNLGVQAIAIHGDRSRRARALQQFLAVAISYPVLLDSGTVAGLYGAAADPTLLLIGPDGLEVKRWTGFSTVDALSGELKAALQALPTPPTLPR